MKYDRCTNTKVTAEAHTRIARFPILSTRYPKGPEKIAAIMYVILYLNITIIKPASVSLKSNLC